MCHPFQTADTCPFVGLSHLPGSRTAGQKLPQVSLSVPGGDVDVDVALCVCSLFGGKGCCGQSCQPLVLSPGGIHTPQ